MQPMLRVSAPSSRRHNQRRELRHSSAPSPVAAPSQPLWRDSDSSPGPRACRPSHWASEPAGTPKPGSTSRSIFSNRDMSFCRITPRACTPCNRPSQDLPDSGRGAQAIGATHDRGRSLAIWKLDRRVLIGLFEELWPRRGTFSEMTKQIFMKWSDPQS